MSDNCSLGSMPASIRLREPECDKKHGVEFVARSEFAAMATNMAVSAVVEVENEARAENGKQRLTVFHQTGVDPMRGEHTEGYHFYEVYTPLSEEEMSELIESISQESRKQAAFIADIYRHDLENMQEEPPLDRYEEELALQIEAEALERNMPSLSEDIPEQER